MQTIGAPSNWRISPRFLTTTFHACIRSQQKNRKVACHEKKVLSITVKLFVSVLFLDKCPVIVSIPRYLSNVLQPSEIFIPTHARFNLSTISLGRRKPLLIIVLDIRIFISFVCRSKIFLNLKLIRLDSILLQKVFLKFV